MRIDRTLRSKFPRQGLHLILPLVATAWLAAPPQARAADVITDAPLSFTVSSGTLTPSGFIIYDVTLQKFLGFDVTYDGLTFDETGVEFVNDNSPLSDFTSGTWEALIQNIDNSFIVGLNLIFTDVAEEPHVLAEDNTNFSVPDGSGSYTPAVPEPSAFALLGTALAGLFLFRIRANRRGRQLRPHQPETA